LALGGDANTAFFHSHTLYWKRKKRKNFIAKLQLDNSVFSLMRRRRRQFGTFTTVSWGLMHRGPP